MQSYRIAKDPLFELAEDNDVDKSRPHDRAGSTVIMNHPCTDLWHQLHPGSRLGSPHSRSLPTSPSDLWLNCWTTRKHYQCYSICRGTFGIFLMQAMADVRLRHPTTPMAARPGTPRKLPDGNRRASIEQGPERSRATMAAGLLAS